MVTLHHVLNFQIVRISAEIRELKIQALKIEMLDRYRFDPDKKSLIAFQVERVREHIAPPHPHWPRYVALKQDCSRWLSALHLLKLGGGQPPPKKDVRKAIRAGRLNFHVRPSEASKFVFGAYALLLQESERFAQHPDQYDDVARFVAKRAEEARRGSS